MEALKGIRILDMTHVQRDPPPRNARMDGSRRHQVSNRPPATPRAGSCATYRMPTASTFTMLNCNKRSITVNMKSPDGKEIFVELLKKCDIVMENFGPGVLDRLGFSWERIH